VRWSASTRRAAGHDVALHGERRVEPAVGLSPRLWRLRGAGIGRDSGY